VARWFDTAKGMRSAAGFAVGRTIYLAPVSEWLTGGLARGDAVERIADTYLRLVRAWID
jgi:myo-inositol catabolism protein IolC